MTESERFATVAAAIEEIRPLIQRDGGDIELVSLDAGRVYVRLMGACTSCGLAVQTLGGVRRRLMDALGEPVMVLPAPSPAPAL